MLFLSFADFENKKIFQEFWSSECQTVWIQLRPDILSGLSWVQTVCKIYQQMTPADDTHRQTTLAGKEFRNINKSSICSNLSYCDECLVISAISQQISVKIKFNGFITCIRAFLWCVRHIDKYYFVTCHVGMICLRRKSWLVLCL